MEFFESLERVWINQKTRSAATTGTLTNHFEKEQNLFFIIVYCILNEFWWHPFDEIIDTLSDHNLSVGDFSFPIIKDLEI